MNTASEIKLPTMTYLSIAPAASLCGVIALSDVKPF